MKTTILTAILLIGCNHSVPVGDLSAEECRAELVAESNDCATESDANFAELEECYGKLEMGAGEQVDLEPSGVVSVATDNDEITNLRLQISSLLAENERVVKRHADDLEVVKMQYNGLLDEYRDIQEKCAETASLLVDLQGICRVNENGIWQTVDVSE